MEDVFMLEAMIGDYLNEEFIDFDDQKRDFINNISKAVLVYDTNNFAANKALGIIDVLKNDTPGAIMHFTRCLSHPEEKSLPAIHLHLGLCFYTIEDFKSAFSHYNVALLYRKMELEEEVETLSRKIQSGWVPDHINAGKDADSRKANFREALRTYFDVATEALYELKDIDLKVPELEKKGDFQNGCDVLWGYIKKHGVS